MKRLIGFVILIAVVSLWILSLRQVGSIVPGGVPAAEYLGEDGSFSIDPSLNFVVKRKPFHFDSVPGPDYTAVDKERVWSSTAGEAPESYFEVWAEFGPVTAGCVVEYLSIDDDPDDRINHFYINDTPVYEVPQGMVSRGRFVVQSGGALRLFANDSVGLWVEPCDSVVSPTPTSTIITPTQTSTPIVTATPITPTLTPTSGATITPTMTMTPSATAIITQTVTPTASPTAGPSVTPTATATAPVSTRVITPTVTPTTPAATPTATSGPGFLETPTPTQEPRLNSCLRINFEVGGDSARRGLYVVQEVGGRVLASWYAEEGWLDSGWVYDIDITFPSVYVQVLFYHGDGRAPVEMTILNPAPGTPHGWLSRGQCHALEVAWPDA
jgi:hypothetical protein